MWRARAEEQRYNYLFVNHNVTTQMNDYGCFSPSKLSSYHKVWKKTEFSMKKTVFNINEIHFVSVIQ